MTVKGKVFTKYKNINSSDVVRTKTFDFLLISHDRKRRFCFPDL